MRTLAAVVVAAALPACWTGPTQPTTPSQIAMGASPAVATPAPAAPTDATPDHYRAQTITADAIGMGLMTIGFIGVHHDWNSNGYGGVLTAGVFTEALASPIIHLAHGRRGRAGGSYLARAAGATMGSFVGMAAACDNGLDALGECGLGRVFMGAGIGLALGGVLDAVLLHDDNEHPSRWLPIVTPTPGGADVGLAARF